jgi:hypothetical protein
MTIYIFETVAAATAVTPRQTQRTLEVWAPQSDTVRFFEPLPPFVRTEHRKDWLNREYRRPRRP